MSGREWRAAPYPENVAPGGDEEWGYVVTAEGRVVRVRRVGDRLVADDGSVMARTVAPRGSERAA